ncbi:hypothetical protein HanXRQr2_Chr12g0557471 [Helianthus annuus]|uniref:Uncharacterized protein n=1 Tax=Helianthus annuus TaxID=4232 RepID=A0A9K3HJF0_HELAN|nr:hypothetical protein HanXRQr2_Chr12g0557471 [Helianthus annuus]KAJ0864006.1 hypothetical protein HanPSC8_Chr12g0536691 [Helianthus annuus]
MWTRTTISFQTQQKKIILLSLLMTYGRTPSHIHPFSNFGSCHFTYNTKVKDHIRGDPVLADCQGPLYDVFNHSFFD